jgi:hypothetical protein
MYLAPKARRHKQLAAARILTEGQTASPAGAGRFNPPPICLRLSVKPVSVESRFQRLFTIRSESRRGGSGDGGGGHGVMRAIHGHNSIRYSRRRLRRRKERRFSIAVLLGSAISNRRSLFRSSLKSPFFTPPFTDHRSLFTFRIHH